MTEPILIANNLAKSFGGIQAVRSASISVHSQQITGLIGPNGAGKTTFFNLLCNFVRSDRGTVQFMGHPIQNKPPYQIAQMGMVRTFQVPKVLSRLTVMENMLLGAQKQIGENLGQLWIQRDRIKQQEKTNRQKAEAILTATRLVHKANDYAGSLSGGQRKLLEMARALMTEPKLILLDEPAAGVNPALIEEICEHIQNWQKQGISFLIIEHNMDVIMSLCDRVWVMAEGQNLVDGTPAEIQREERVLEAYLGAE